MKSLSRRNKTLIALVLFVVSYLAIYWLWVKAQPLYGRFLAAASDGIVNAIGATDTSYKIEFVDSVIQVKTRVSYGPPGKGMGRNSRGAGRQIDEVSYNLCLWAALLVATAPFVNSSSRWRFLLIGFVLMVFWHVCAVTICANYYRMLLIETLYHDYPDMVSYSSGWHWFWESALVLNLRIMDPLLPMFLWILFCSRSFFEPTAEDRRSNK